MINFNAGPAALPFEVKLKIQQDLLDYEKSGCSVLELPHRGTLIQELITKTSDLLQSLMNLPDHYQILWMQGGGRLQFHTLPLNFLTAAQKAGYIISGHWSKQAYLEALKLGDASIISSSEALNYQSLPSLDNLTKAMDHNSTQWAYLHYCSNNTIYGTQFNEFKSFENVPLVADMSSDILSRDIDYSQFDLIYAAAQKNLGIAGITMVAVKEEFLNQAANHLPDILSYKSYSRTNSTVNTPAVFAILTTFRMLEWLHRKGMDYVFQENLYKAQMIYQFLDRSLLFEAIADEGSRSFTTVCFRLKNRSLQQTEEVLTYLQKEELLFLAGHRTIGGFRAGMYNAISIAEVEHLVQTLDHYEKSYFLL